MRKQALSYPVNLKITWNTFILLSNNEVFFRSNLTEQPFAYGSFTLLPSSLPFFSPILVSYLITQARRKKQYLRNRIAFQTDIGRDSFQCDWRPHLAGNGGSTSWKCFLVGFSAFTKFLFFFFFNSGWSICGLPGVEALISRWTSWVLFFAMKTILIQKVNCGIWKCHWNKHP